ncbi:MAG: polyphosphate kinase 1 [Cytophagales bacterium]|nr:polyphosphate kinase 1 [Cytophagales bacterium]
MLNEEEFFDRDLSWLSFNYRVLMEAMDKELPLLERLKFIAIYSSNLDEFFRVRVASIRHLILIDKKKIYKRIDFNPQNLLTKLLDEVDGQLELYGAIFKEILDALEEKHLTICTNSDDISKDLFPELLYYFKTHVAAYLKPESINESSKIFLDNQAIYLAVRFESKEHSIVKIPTDKLARFFKTQHKDQTIFVFLDDVIRLHLDIIFPNEKIIECRSIKMNKDADLQIDDEYSGDLVEKIEKQINKRNLGIPSRFLYDMNMSKELLQVLSTKLHLGDEDLTAGGRYHNLNDLFQISSNQTELEYPKQPQIGQPELDNCRSLFSLIEKEDRIFHFPYHSYDYILQFFNEAAIDPEVEEINVTFYRMAKKSIIAEALISAASNGKKVRVFMEVKARFDEENNLLWARRMEEAGIKIIFSLPGLKVHAKVALIKKRKGMFGFFGTGNLNENTSKIYCDHGLLSADKEMTQELSNVFEFLLTGERPIEFKQLIVSQFSALETFVSLIDREIAHAEAGEKAEILVKINNLQEQTLISKLYEAAEKGVEVRVIARSICCLIPNKNIKVKRLVDRYLEHARVFYFYNNGEQNLFMGSSDWMNRNLHRRVEVSFPVHSGNIKEEILRIINLQWEDDVKAVWLSPEMKNEVIKSKKKVRAQQAAFEFLRDQ